MNRGNRVSDCLSIAQAKNLADAVQFAWWTEQPLNLLVTIHLEKAEVTGRPQDFVVRFLKLAGDWLGLRGLGRYYIWVLEKPPGGGLNLHIMIHWIEEDTRELRRRFVGWLKISGGKNHRKVLHAQYVGIGPGAGCYLLKGADRSFCDEWLGLEHRFQGAIRGKRCGTSESLGASARKINKLQLPPSWRTQGRHYVLGLPHHHPAKIRTMTTSLGMPKTFSRHIPFHRWTCYPQR